MKVIQTDSSDNSIEPPCGQAEHDVLACLAIAKGFETAIETSYKELFDTYRSIVHSMQDGISDSSIEELKQSERDVKFGLSRLVRSIEQLKSRLEDVGDAEDPAVGESSRIAR